jgi:probable F420-dependent oxidoreductase
MTTSGRWGITLPLPGIPLARQHQIVAGLPALGYTDAWSSELNGADAFTPLALAAQWAAPPDRTDSPADPAAAGGGLRLGTAVAGIYTRGPGLLAMNAATLAGLAPGRFVLGIGTSSRVAVEQWNGVPFDRPYQRARDTLRFLRAALSGAKVSERYETISVHGFRLEQPPAVPPRLALAALRPGMLRLAAAEADAAITNWLAPADVPTVRGAAGTGCELVARIFVCPFADADQARPVGRWLLAAYLTVPVYAAFQDWLGRGDLLAPMQAAWAAGDRKAALAAIPDRAVDDLLVYGSPEACRERVSEYLASGLDTAVIAIVPLPGTDIEEAVRALAPR